MGFVSLFMDVSSEMVHGLLPVFLTGTLGASAMVLGLIEGAGEGFAQIVKLFSGNLSDRMARRKPMAILGYGLSALTKPVFALAGGAGMILTARLADRLGKGIRGAPRDALVADLVGPEQRGAAYGLRQSMDTAGAVLGPLAAIGLMVATSGNIRLIFALAILPALIAVAILIFAVREPPRKTAPPPARPRLGFADMARLGNPFWQVAATGGLLTLARISEAFVILRALDAGLPVALSPLVLVALNLVYAASAWPAGVLADRIGSRGLLRWGVACLIASQVLLAQTPGPLVFALGIALWGLHMGLTQGLLAREVANHCPQALRGTAFGAFSLISGLALLVGNFAAGTVWSLYGASASFTLGATVAAVALAAMLVLPQWRSPKASP